MTSKDLSKSIKINKIQTAESFGRINEKNIDSFLTKKRLNDACVNFIINTFLKTKYPTEKNKDILIKFIENYYLKIDTTCSEAIYLFLIKKKVSKKLFYKIINLDEKIVSVFVKDDFYKRIYYLSKKYMDKKDLSRFDIVVSSYRKFSSIRELIDLSKIQLIKKDTRNSSIFESTFQSSRYYTLSDKSLTDTELNELIDILSREEFFSFFRRDEIINLCFNNIKFFKIHDLLKLKDFSIKILEPNKLKSLLKKDTTSSTEDKLVYINALVNKWVESKDISYCPISILNDDDSFYEYIRILSEKEENKKILSILIKNLFNTKRKAQHKNEVILLKLFSDEKFSEYLLPITLMMDQHAINNFVTYFEGSGVIEYLFTKICKDKQYIEESRDLSEDIIFVIKFDELFGTILYNHCEYNEIPDEILRLFLIKSIPIKLITRFLKNAKLDSIKYAIESKSIPKQWFLSLSDEIISEINFGRRKHVKTEIEKMLHSVIKKLKPSDYILNEID